MSFTEQTPYRRGYEDAQNGKEFYENPFFPGTPDHNQYRDGWEDVAGEIGEEE